MRSAPGGIPGISEKAPAWQEEKYHGSRSPAAAFGACAWKEHTD